MEKVHSLLPSGNFQLCLWNWDFLEREGPTLNTDLFLKNESREQGLFQHQSSGEFL
jgi:hypothetical protein